MRNLIRGLIPALMLAALPLAPMQANAEVALGISVNFAPPELPVYVQPEIPAPGYLWTPGYWAWAPDGYYWVPGTWVLPPAVGLLWTPGVLGLGRWSLLLARRLLGTPRWILRWRQLWIWLRRCRLRRRLLARSASSCYNRAVCNVRNINVVNVYTRPVAYHGHENRVSFNGGAGGIVARPSRRELSASHERHVAFTGPQRRAGEPGALQYRAARLGQRRSPAHRGDSSAWRVQRSRRGRCS